MPSNLPTLDPAKFGPPGNGLPTLDPAKFGTPAPSSPSWSTVGSQALSNLVPSSEHVASSMIHPLLHPVDTGKALLDEAAHPLDTAHHLANYIDQRYGNLENFKKTLGTDPAGALADLSLVLNPERMIAGNLAKKGIKGAATAEKAIKAVDPTVAAGKVGSMVATGAKNAVAKTLGFTTGMGPHNVDMALKGDKSFRQGMRNSNLDYFLVKQAKDALQTLKTQRSEAYKADLAKISNRTSPVMKGAIGPEGGATIDLQPIHLDMAPVNQKLHLLLTEYGIKKAPDGSWSFRGSRIPHADQGDVQRVIDMVSDHGSTPAETLVGSVDALKRHIGEAIPKEGSARAFLTALHSSVKDVLNKNVPGYKDMAARYAKHSQMIDEIQRTLSLRDTNTTDTALRKLQTAMREMPDFRKTLIAHLDAQSPGLASALAGRMMKDWYPSGLTSGRLASMIGIGGVGELGAGHPGMLAGLALTSPRLIGEGLNAGASVVRPAASLLSKIPPQLLYRLGQTTEGQQALSHILSGSPQNGGNP